jgi:hypothetical protein
MLQLHLLEEEGSVHLNLRVRGCLGAPIRKLLLLVEELFNLDKLFNNRIKEGSISVHKLLQLLDSNNNNSSSSRHRCLAWARHHQQQEDEMLGPVVATEHKNIRRIGELKT